jgi:hypothetical protein
MYFLFTTVLAASFLIKSEFTAVTFAAEVLYTVAYLILFSKYFQKNHHIHVFIPLLLVSFSLHLVFFLMELQKDYIKGINIWILVLLLYAVCLYIAFGTSSNTGITAFTHMCSPIFFILLFLAIINILTGKLSENPVIGKSIYQYFLSIISPPSVALTLTYMHKCCFKKIYPAFISALGIAVFFFLMDAPFFRSIALNFTAPVLISAELLAIKEAILWRKDLLDKSGNQN